LLKEFRRPQRNSSILPGAGIEIIDAGYRAGIENTDAGNTIFGGMAMLKFYCFPT
jgi:hypothetical protein